jgi:curved DNA-binding protein
MAGSDYEAVVRISFEQAFHGTEVDLELSVLEWDPDGGVRRVPHRVKARIPRGVTDGEKLRVPGKGGKGANGGPNGDLYLDIEVQTHPFYRVDGQDLYVDLPLAPWEAVLGASIALPTPAGIVNLKVPAGTRAGQQLRLAGRGLARPNGSAGNLFAIVQIAVPTVTDDAQRALYRQLAETSNFNPRAHFEREATHEP